MKETSIALNPAEKDAVQRATNMQGCSTTMNAFVVIAMVLMAKHQSLTATHHAELEMVSVEEVGGIVFTEHQTVQHHPLLLPV